MKKIFLATLSLLAVTAIAAPRRVWLSNSNSATTTAPSPTIDVINRTETNVTFRVHLDGFAVQNSSDGVSLRLGGNQESQPRLGDPDISGLTVFLPFNAPVRGSATSISSGRVIYTPDQLGGRVKLATDPELPTPTSTMNVGVMPEVSVGDPGVFKDFGVLPVTIFPVRTMSDGSVVAASEVTVNVTATYTGPVITSPITRSFDEIYETTLLGYANFSMGRSRLWRPGTYLIMRRPNVDTNYVPVVNLFVRNKRLEGYNVIVDTTTASTQDQIKQIILNEYQSLANTLPIEYVLLIGEADQGTTADEMPTFTYTIPSPLEVVPTDLPYVRLDGADIWPEALLGRISVVSYVELATVVNKTVRHQNTPYVGVVGTTGITAVQKMRSALMFAGNFAGGAPPPITPTQNTEAAAELLREHGYTTHEYLYPPAQIPGTDSLLYWINSGVSLITYRGWGDSNGPLVPRLQILDLAGINNVYTQAPFISIVCQNGRYAMLDGGTCFGEAWCKLGTPSPTGLKGGPAFFGASHLHTSTRYNNVILGGYVQGWLTEHLDKLGLAALRAKLEVYRGFPLEPTAIEEYFSFYNILGDPSLQLWVGAPDSMQVMFPATLSASNSTVGVHVTNNAGVPLPNMIATVLVGKTIPATAGRNQGVAVTDASGNANIPLQVTTNDTVVIEVRGGNYRPQLVTRYVTGAITNALRVDSVSFADGNNHLPEPGEQANLLVYVTNVSSAAVNAQVALAQTSSRNRISIINGTSNAGTINANATGTLTFTIRICSLADQTPLALELNRSGELTDFIVPIGFCYPFVSNYSVSSGTLIPGQSATVQLSVKNQGTSPIPVSSYMFSTFSNGITNLPTAWSTTANSVAEGDSIIIPVNIAVSGTIIPGQVIPVRLFMTIPDGGSDTMVTNFNLICGTRPVNYPTGPDNYGYYAYQNSDSVAGANWPLPTYNWRECDPDSGGNGTLVRLEDDQTFSIALPFSIQYYGVTYQPRGLSICSNGWVSFDSTQFFDFYNWALPCANGPRTLVAPNWDDLKGLPEDSGRVWIAYHYNASDTTLIIEWSRCYSRYGIETIPVKQRFEVVFYGNRRGPTGDNVIDFIYNLSSDIDAGNNYTTIGIMNWDHTDGLDLTYAHSPAPGFDSLRNHSAVRFTTQAPDNFLGLTQPVKTIVPNTFAVSQGYPNPFNPSVVVSISLPKSSEVVAKVYDQIGREVATLANGHIQAGTYSLHWNATGNASGVYFIRIKAGSFEALRKVVYIR